LFPFIHVSEGVDVPTYYLVLSIAVSIALIWIVRRAQAQDLPQRPTLDLSLLVMVSGFIGGRLFHVVYEEPDYYRDNPSQIIAFWNGGFVFYGGALLAGFCALFYIYKNERRDLGRFLDLFAPVLAFTYAIGRGACLLAGCCYGKYCELPWAIDNRHPTQIYAGLWEFGVILILLGLEKREHKAGFIFSVWMVLHGLGRLMMEFFRDDFRGPQLGFSISSWISIAIIATGLFFIIKKKNA
jgi:phosphatidylglycerol:prolipoprotein diacylglycerol transferase